MLSHFGDASRRHGCAFRHIGASRIDDLHAEVLVGEGLVLVLGLLLAEAYGRQALAIYVAGLDQKGFDRIRAPFATARGCKRRCPWRRYARRSTAASFASLKALPSSSRLGRACGRISAESKSKKISISTFDALFSSTVICLVLNSRSLSAPVASLSLRRRGVKWRVLTGARALDNGVRTLDVLCLSACGRPRPETTAAAATIAGIDFKTRILPHGTLRQAR